MLIVLVAIAIVIAVDQVAKQLVVGCLSEGEVGRKTSRVQVRRITNVRGWAGDEKCPRGLSLLIWALTLFGIGVLVTSGTLFQNDAAHAGLGLAMGGATANLADRLWRAGVVDFIDVGCWPVFNIADVAIVMGLAVAVWFIR